MTTATSGRGGGARLLVLAPLQEPTSGAAMRGARVGGPHVRREGHATVTTTQPVQALRG